MVVAEGVGRALNPDLNMWQLAQPLIESWIADNLGPQAQLRSAVEDGLEAARRLPNLVERGERLLEAVAGDGIRLDSRSLEALAGRPDRTSGRLLPWALCLLLGGLALGLLLH